MIRALCTVTNLLILMYVGVQVQCYLSDIEKSSLRLDELLAGVESPISIEIERDMKIWQEYEFETGVGNREELVIENITTKIDHKLSESIKNYQLVEREGEFFMAGSSDLIFSLYKLDLKNDKTILKIDVKLDRKIINFKLFNLPDNNNPENDANAMIIAILGIESTNGTDLWWYRLTGNNLVRFWSWSVEKRVERIQFFHHDKQNRLLLIRETDEYNQQLDSPFDIYGFIINDKRPNKLWLAQQLTVPKTFDLQVCPAYESPIVALQRRNEVILYEFNGERTKEGLFKNNQNITSYDLHNIICFDSGYLRYLVTSGPQSGLYDFFENEFQQDLDSKDPFNELGEILWIQSIPVDTYREESILLVQLKNLTILGFSWNGQGFKKMARSDFGKLDLSQATVIPKYGLIYGNKFVKINTKLIEKPKLLRDEMLSILERKKKLEEVLIKQEVILDETEIRINQSYFMNPDVTGCWNITDLEVESVIIEDEVVYDEISVGTKTIKPIEFLSNIEETKNLLSDLESKLLEMKSNLANAVPINSRDVTLTGDLVIDGGLEIQKILSATNFQFEKLNGLTIEEILQDFWNYNDTMIIKGEKTFESIDATVLRVGLINGLINQDIKFDNVRQDYSSVDFSKLTKLELQGNLNFNEINNVNWEDLMNTVVRKSQHTKIPGVTIVEGDLISSDINIGHLNGLQYSKNYVLENRINDIELTGSKKFKKLIIGTLDMNELKTINGVSIDEYVTLMGDRQLSEEITFENLVVTDVFQVDGNITGLSDSEKGAGLSLNETDTVMSDIVFAKLTILGNLNVDNTTNQIIFSNLDDLVSRTDEFVEINGEKIFLDEVKVGSDLIIESQKINGHAIQEFVTLDTEQVLPHLERIFGNVTFKNVVRNDVESLKNLLTENLDDNGHPKCLNKSILFNVSPIVDHIFLDKVNGVNASDFTSGVRRTFMSIKFQSLEIQNLTASRITAINIKGSNFEKLRKNTISKTSQQILRGDLEIEILETQLLNAHTVNGLSIEQLENTRNQLNDIYHKLLHGNLSIDTLTVYGSVKTLNINGESIDNIYVENSMGTVKIPNEIRVENLTVLGYTHGINFTEFVEDTVLITDTEIVITSHKIFEKIECEFLDVQKVNGRSIDHILDPKKHQIISGSVKVNGTVRILNDFKTQGKIGGVSWQGIKQRFEYLGENTYSLSGDLNFNSEEIIIKNLVVTNTIQGVHFDNFLNSVVYKKSENLTIQGLVIFKDQVTIDSPFMITETFNDLNLKYFYENAVRIDRAFVIKSKVVFTESIVVEEDLIVDEKLEVKTIGGVEISELYENAAYVDRPTFISGTSYLENVIFESNIEVDTINDMDLKTVITLNGDQTLYGNLHCKDITVGKLDSPGIFNGHDLGDIYDDTFTLIGDQNINGRIVVIGNVLIRHNFDANYINKVNPVEFIPLDVEDTIKGNFVFEKPITVHGNLLSSGLINNIDVKKWQATAVTRKFPFKQIVKGAWHIHGNVHFNGSVSGSELLDGVNVTKLVDDLHQRDVVTNLEMEDSKRDLQSMCEDLFVVKESAENRIYKYKYLDYLQVLNFDRSIISVHHYEIDDVDYLLVNFENCHLDIFFFTGTEFTNIASIPDIAIIERWFTFDIEGDHFFLTIGKPSCNKNSGNLWKLIDPRTFIHVEDLGNVDDAKKINNNEVLLIVNGSLIHRSITEIDERSLNNPKSYTIGSQKIKFISDSRQVLLVNENSIYEHYIVNETGIALINYFGTNEIQSFLLGVNKIEIFVYYDERISEDYLFISDNNLFQNKILQTINVQQPSSIMLLNFENFIENFLIFLENHQKLQIYEYQGIEGFLHRETININVQKIFQFKIRKYSKLAKKQYIAAIQGQRLVILEAKMYGEKLDINNRPCEF